MISKSAWVLLPLLALAGCGDSDDDNNDKSPVETTSPLSLSILHINDHHSHLEAESQVLDIAGQPTEFSSGGFARVAAKMSERAAELPNVLKLHAGDAITGTLYFTSFKGEADAELMNLICFDAFALGNHEFDGSDEGLKAFLDELGEGGCNTPVLAANVKPEVGTPLAPTAEDDYIKPYVVKDVDGQKVGIIGIDIATKTQNSSSPLVSTRFLPEVETAQAMIDELEADGVNKIVLLTHYQYQNDLALAAELTGVDVIIGGDSHSLLGDFEPFGLNSSGAYPTMATNADGGQVCIGQAWQYAKVVGELQVNWDAEGVVESCSGVPHLLLGDTISRTDETSGNDYSPQGDELQSILNAVAEAPQLSIVQEEPVVADALARYTVQLDEFRNKVVGMATEDLCLARIPGKPYGDESCSGEDAMRGGDIPNVVAQAFLFLSKNADVAIQNAGGVRTDILQGDITIGDAYTLLPFANTLTDLTITGAEIEAVLNEAVDYAHTDSSGAYPYAAGLRWTVDMNRPAGQRLYGIEVRGRDETQWRALADTETLNVVTNSFTAEGRDGYVTFGTVSEDGRAVDTFLDYAQSFVDYVDAKGTLSKPALGEYSTQLYTPPN
ncbi:5'-nucleotidase C-terminal domain-containing protein [Hydrocarboniclastica marina]|uniref:Bifunctional metallophosphatase/5'-nucleotidase n=1 Tax=Hydrocarboniclastica marina TaxID=2259620 RepID=A0A4P7XKR3_9ALTE|nr:5'-nucleotidase C-terminal domain-containing protein [Hydrocarboniclastica marina]QCF26932.1 bifunctional metallophosphatase/5'-nucleotidase [Hydrocarboniclastica marina]